MWDYLSDNLPGSLKKLVEGNGIRGCWLYWAHTLHEEAADFAIDLSQGENAGCVLTILKQGGT